MTKAIDLTNLRFGKLKALARCENDPMGRAQWVCACDCGGAHISRCDHLMAGRVKKCPACVHTPERITAHAWYYVTLIEANGGYVQGSAGFIELFKGTRMVYRSPWIEDRHMAKRESPVVVQGLRGASKAGAIRCGRDGPSIGSWIRRHKADFRWNTFNEGEKVWAAWYARTSEWKGPQQSEQQLDTIMSSLRVKSA